MAAQPSAVPASTASVPKARPAWTSAIDAAPSEDEIVILYESSPPNVRKTRTLSASLDERFKKESFVSSHIKVDEVDCRGEACRVRLSFADAAPPEPIVLELSGAIPDSHSFQEFATAPNNRRTVTSHYIDDASNATARTAPRPR